jgi:hypothetical protein
MAGDGPRTVTFAGRVASPDARELQGAGPKWDLLELQGSFLKTIAISATVPPPEGKVPSGGVHPPWRAADRVYSHAVGGGNIAPSVYDNGCRKSGRLFGGLSFRCDGSPSAS